MAQALVGANFDLATDVSLNFTAEVTLYLPGALDDITKSSNLIIGQVVGAQVRRNTSLLQQFLGTGRADSVNVGECDLHALVARQVNTS